MANQAALYTDSKFINPIQLFAAGQRIIADRDPEKRPVEDHILDWPGLEEVSNEWGILRMHAGQNLPCLLYMTWSVYGYRNRELGVGEELPEWRIKLSIGNGCWSYIADIGEWLEARDAHWWWNNDSDSIVHVGKDKIAIARGEVPYPTE